jgi:hypothetical protein
MRLRVSKTSGAPFAESAPDIHFSSSQSDWAARQIVAAGSFNRITPQKQTGLTNIVDGTMVMVYDS